jgi:hypothetical protein
VDKSIASGFLNTVIKNPQRGTGMKSWKALSKSGTRLFVAAKTRNAARQRLEKMLGIAITNLMLDTDSRCVAGDSSESKQ